MVAAASAAVSAAAVADRGKIKTKAEIEGKAALIPLFTYNSDHFEDSLYKEAKGVSIDIGIAKGRNIRKSTYQIIKYSGSPS